MFDKPHHMFCSYNNDKQRYLKSRDKTGARIHLASAAEAGGLVSLLRFFYFNLFSFSRVRLYFFSYNEVVTFQVCLITNPIWVVKTRLQLQTPQNQFRPYTGVGGMLDRFYVLNWKLCAYRNSYVSCKYMITHYKYMNNMLTSSYGSILIYFFVICIYLFNQFMVSDALKTILRDEGWRAFYRGLVPGLFLVRFGIVNYLTFFTC